MCEKVKSTVDVQLKFEKQLFTLEIMKILKKINMKTKQTKKDQNKTYSNFGTEIE